MASTSMALFEITLSYGNNCVAYSTQIVPKIDDELQP